MIASLQGATKGLPRASEGTIGAWDEISSQRPASPWRNWNRRRSFAHRLTSGFERYLRTRPQCTVG
jgi:hypothetical protein